MRRAGLGLPAAVAAVAMVLALMASVAVGQAAAGVVRLASVGSVRSAGGNWGTALEVPGTARLNTAGAARITSVSCAAAGNCSAGGFYSTAPLDSVRPSRPTGRPQPARRPRTVWGHPLTRTQY
jgi:hypothetical protein